MPPDPLMPQPFPDGRSFQDMRAADQVLHAVRVLGEGPIAEHLVIERSIGGPDGARRAAAELASRADDQVMRQAAQAADAIPAFPYRAAGTTSNAMCDHGLCGECGSCADAKNRPFTYAPYKGGPSVGGTIFLVAVVLLLVILFLAW